MTDEQVCCPRCRGVHIEEHQEPGDLPWWECMDCGLCWDGSEGREEATAAYRDLWK